MIMIGQHANDWPVRESSASGSLPKTQMLILPVGTSTFCTLEVLKQQMFSTALLFVEHGISPTKRKIITPEVHSFFWHRSPSVAQQTRQHLPICFITPLTLSL
jgi:hypothetical protein